MRNSESNGMDDVTLNAVLGNARQGDTDALAQLFREFHPRVMALCRYFLRSRQEAEDAASDVFARLPKSMKTYDSTLPFPKWLISVTSHYCIDLLRRRRTELRIFEPTDEPTPEAVAAQPSALEELVANEERSTVRAAIAGLPERCRLPLVMRYYNELTYDEIAQALELSRANVATLIFRAKQELRAALVCGKKT